MYSLENEILSLQADSGAFHSKAQMIKGEHDDWNAFATALAIRAMGSGAGFPGWSAARERAIDFLTQCEVPGGPPCYAFWPPGKVPSWIARLPPDADDTAVIAAELLRHGRISLMFAREIAKTALIPHRLTGGDAGHPWIRPGAFLTWLRPMTPNPIDCCVNANVVAFLTQIGLTDAPGYRESCSLLADAIRWSAERPDRIELLTPYYPHQAELLFAVRNAVNEGATILQETLDLLAKLMPDPFTNEEDPPVFGTHDKLVVWHSRVVWACRRVRHSGAAQEVSMTASC